MSDKPWCVDVMKKLDRIEALELDTLEHLSKHLDRIDAVQATHIRDHEKLRLQLDRIEKSMRSYDENKAMLDSLDCIEKLLEKPARVDFSHPAVKESELFKLLENVFEKLEEMK